MDAFSAHKKTQNIAIIHSFIVIEQCLNDN